ncbi:9757_t:CDS:2 [Diversispora eburnea]|uniref:9757_t:CDS:1 n=1 Tax=Diversispora eburnea TaxID=1213867 RepID=A0A9N8WA63_9GLOM|nr:9757_t:CDS:2 [Diversispora eburnea]
MTKISKESFNSDSQPYNQKISSKKNHPNNYLKISEQCPEVSNSIITDQVISVETLTAHLNLLIRFTNINCNNQNLFLRYLARAEHRYIIWLNLLDHYRPPIESMPIPPLEDVIRLYGEHMLTYNFPLLKMNMKDKEGDEYVDMNSLKTWKSFSDDEPYLLEFDDDRPFLITCPFCIKDNYLDPDLYVQLKMNASTHTCENCSLQLNADILSAKRLLNDINQFLSDNTKCLAGTLLDTEKNQIDNYIAVNDNILLFDQDVIRELIRLSSYAYTGKPSPPSLYIPNITNNCNWQIIQQEFSTILHQLDSQGDLRYVRKNILNQVISAYQNLICPFSLDLMAAVIRYQETVDKILYAGDWNDECIIALATVRYHKFLILTQKYPDRLLVPTMAKTALLWHKKFNEPYTSDDPSRKWKKTSRVVMSVMFPVYGLYVAQRLWKLGKTRDKKIGPGGSINKSSWVTSNSCDINSNERRV